MMQTKRSTSALKASPLSPSLSRWLALTRMPHCPRAGPWPSRSRWSGVSAHARTREIPHPTQRQFSKERPWFQKPKMLTLMPTFPLPLSSPSAKASLPAGSPSAESELMEQKICACNEKAALIKESMSFKAKDGDSDAHLPFPAVQP